MEYRFINDIVTPVKKKGSEGQKPYLEIGDIDIITKAYSLKDKLSVSNPLIGEKDDIIVSKVRPTRGAISILREKLLVSNAFSVLKAKESVLPKYLFYFLSYSKSFRKHLETRQVGSSYPSCRERDILEFKVPFCSFETQKKITSILDKANELRQNDRIILKKYDELMRSVFFDLFGDPFSNGKRFRFLSIGELSEKIQIGPFGSQLHKIDYIVGGVPLINPTHIELHKIVPDLNFTISTEKYISLPNYHIRKGDIIMGRRGEMGRSAIVTSVEDGWFCGTGSLFIRTNSMVNSVYLSFAISTDEGVRYLENEAQGITMKNLNKAIIQNIKIGLPEIGQQNKFALIVEKIETQKQNTIKSLQKSEELFQSLLQRAFKGELV